MSCPILRETKTNNIMHIIINEIVSISELFSIIAILLSSEVSVVLIFHFHILILIHQTDVFHINYFQHLIIHQFYMPYFIQNHM